MGLIAQAWLGQASGSGDTGQLLVWIGALIVAVVIGTVALLMIRRRMVGQRLEDRHAFSTMEEMRAMVDRGEMSQEEYEQVRKAMIARVKAEPKPTGTPSRGSEVGDADRETDPPRGR